MRPQMIQAIQTGVRFPRVSGDAPADRGFPVLVFPFSPRERGCARRLVAVRPLHQVFPA